MFQLIKLLFNLWESDYFTYELWHNLIFHLLYKSEYAIHKLKSNFHLLHKSECAIHKLKSNRWDRFTITAWWFFSARFRFIYMFFFTPGRRRKEKKGWSHRRLIMGPLQIEWVNYCLFCSYLLLKRSPSEDFLSLTRLFLIHWVG